MKNIIAFAITILFSTLSVAAQDCKFYYPKTQGAQLEYKSFDSKTSLLAVAFSLLKK